MLPLVQMQPCAMSRSTHTHTHASLRQPSDYFDHDRHARNHASSSFPRAFPIRTSQSHRRAALHSGSPYPPRSEHHRRKHQGSIVTTTYDGPPRVTAGPSSREHLSLSANANLGLYQHYTPSFPPPPMPPQQQWRSSSRSFPPRNQVDGGGVPWTTNNDPWASYGTLQAGLGGFQPISAGTFANQTSFPNIYQPVMRANEYNVRAFCPPPIPMSEALSFGYGGWQPSASPWSYRDTTFAHNQGPSQPFYGHHMANNHGPRLPGSAQTPYVPVDTFIYDSAGPAPGNFSSAPSGFDALANIVGPSNLPDPQQGFRQRAMAQAHQAYINLISHLQANRKPQEHRGGSRVQGQSRLCVYPKPPNPVPIGGFDNSPGAALPLDSNYLKGNGELSAQSNFNHPSSLNNSSGQRSTVFPNMSGAAAQAQPQFGSTYPSWDGATQSGYGYVHYASQARSCLEILNALCEQSGWKWTDGMLLGGCLHYGLESYETALSWFSRVTAFDPRY